MSAIVRVQQDAEQEEDLLGGTHAAREDHDRVGNADEGLEALLHVRHDHQFVDDRVGRLGGDDPGLGQADIPAIAYALLGVADGGALHRALHGAGAAAGAHVQLAQAELVAGLLGVVVFLPVDGVPAPAHDDIRVGPAFSTPALRSTWNTALVMP